MTTEEPGKSLSWIVVAASILVVVCGWGILAGSYVGSHTKAVSELEPEEREELSRQTPRQFRRRLHTRIFFSFVPFVSNAVTQLPNFPAVISWHFSNRIWLPLLIILVEIGVIGGGIGLRRLESRLAAPPGGRKREATAGAMTRPKRRRKRQPPLGNAYGDIGDGSSGS